MGFELHPPDYAAEVSGRFRRNTFWVVPDGIAGSADEGSKQWRESETGCDLLWRSNATPDLCIVEYQRHFFVRIFSTQAPPVLEQVLESTEGWADIGFGPVNEDAMWFADEYVPWIKVAMPESACNPRVLQL